MDIYEPTDAEVLIGGNGNAVLSFSAVGAPPSFALIRFAAADRADLLRDDDSIVRIHGKNVVTALRESSDLMIVETIDGLPVRRYPGIRAVET